MSDASNGGIAPHEQPEWDGERCKDCGRGYQLVWNAEHELWNAIWGNEGGLLCPDCFDVRCRAQGIYLRFRAVPTLDEHFKPDFGRKLK